MLRNLTICLLCSVTAAVTSINCKHEQPAVSESVSLPRAEVLPVVSEAADSLFASAEAQGIELHSLMIVQGDSVLYERWLNGAHADSLHVLYSVSKTFTSLGVGLAISDSILSLDDRIIDIFDDCLPDSVSDNLAAITVEDLLIMSSGHAHATEIYTDLTERAKSDTTLCWAHEFMSYPIEYEPGTVFSYNSIGTFMLSAAVQKRSGMKLIDYLTPRLFEPLGISNAVWEENPEGINLGGWGLYLTTEDLAKAGKLLLDRGKWNGKQIVPSEWVDAMTARHIQSIQGTPNSAEYTFSDEELASSDWLQGYGYQLWRCRHNAFRADGSLGQFIVVIPDVDAVVVMTANSHAYQPELNLVWDYILPVLTDLQKNQ